VSVTKPLCAVLKWTEFGRDVAVPPLEFTDGRRIEALSGQRGFDKMDGSLCTVQLHEACKWIGILTAVLDWRDAI
jgi:hypothetical protein